MRFKIFTLLVLLFTVNQVFSFVTVGNISSGACNYTSLSQALNNSEDEIRLVDDDITDNLEINYSVSITGGYTNCILANNPNTPVPSAKTFIYGTAVLGESVIKINLSNTFVGLNNLYVTGGRQDVSVVDGGHGIKIEGAGSVTITDTTIADNRSSRGGGVYLLEDGATKYVRLINTVVFGNIAESTSSNAGLGGGIFCRGSGSLISIEGESVIAFNTARSGGGIAARYGCFVRVSAGIDVNNSSTRRGVMNNQASEFGGGVYVTNDAIIEFNPTRNGLFIVTQSDSDHPATLANNSANQDGGGGYVALGGEIRMLDSLVHGNSANNGSGGAFAIVGFSRLTVKRSDFGCWDPGACIVFSNNTASSGGALSLSPSDSSSSFVNNTVFKGNRAIAGTLFSLSGSPAISQDTLQIFDSLIVNNGNNGLDGFDDSNLISLQNGARLTMVGVTIADNDIANSSAIISNSTSALFLRDSIIFNDNNIYVENQSTGLQFDCLVVNENVSVSGNNVYVEDPGFVNSAAGDYHLRPDSFAIDLCSNGGNTRMDLDDEPRNIDIINVSNVEGNLDAGSDEYNDFEGVFKNGFE